MKKYYIKKFSCVFFAATTLLFATTSCELDEDIRGAVAVDTFYGTKTAVDDGIYGLYALYGTTPDNARLYKDNFAFFTGADDLGAPDDKSTFYEADVFNLTGANSYQTKAWTGYYKAINGCNEFIANVDLETFADDEEFYYDAIANARFLRGIMYFDLVLFFGDVPLFTEPTLSTSVKRSPSWEVMEQVIVDLEYAKKWLVNPDRDTDAGVSAQTINQKASKTAAKAWLAKAYMAQAGWPIKRDVDNSWAQVKKNTKEIIDEGVYTMLDDYSHNFGNVGEPISGVQDWEGNAEAIWTKVCFSSEQYGTDSRYFGRFWQDWMDVYVEHKFYEDMRKDYRGGYSVTNDTTWTYHGFTTWPYCDTYNHPTVMKFLWGGMTSRNYKRYNAGSKDGFPGFESDYRNSADITYIRYSEVLLMYAEACARTNENTEAIEYLNKVRRRAYANGLPAVKDTIANASLPVKFWDTPNSAVDYPLAGETFLDTKTSNPVIDAIIAERAWEFLAEPGGIRWFDVTRLEIVGDVLKHRIDGSDDRERDFVGDPDSRLNWRMPIPAVEFSYNPGL